MIIRALVAVALPLLVLFGGGSLMNYAIGRRVPPDPSKPEHALNLRWRGYDAQAVATYWGPLDQDGVTAERTFLKVDLVFPLLFAAALIAGLRMSAALADTSVPPLLYGLVLIGVLADWTENTGQLRLLKGVVSGSDILPSTLDVVTVRIASMATITKLLALLLAWLGIAAYCASVWRRP